MSQPYLSFQSPQVSVQIQLQDLARNVTDRVNFNICVNDSQKYTITYLRHFNYI